MTVSVCHAARSRHAETRQQGRATLPLFESLLLDYGTRMRTAGADIVFLDKAARKRLCHAVGGKRGLRLLERHLNQYLVVSDEGQIITTGHRTRRINRA
ncbi:hypothetical protein [Acetobacter pasteurianus]|uniref:hypothetical protein n=1 Tax=Acetobacter pasteurianus TaxID=438 RepID=UPI00248FAA9D|nr:hypothetical protein [Acetobacter pasteurianus]